MSQGSFESCVAPFRGWGVVVGCTDAKLRMGDTRVRVVPSYWMEAIWDHTIIPYICVNNSDDEGNTCDQKEA
eukprot:scaffold1410_cov154-Amphora_coffeaeformis.AAC.7